MSYNQPNRGSVQGATRRAAWLTLAARIVFLPLLLMGAAHAQSFSVLYNFGPEPDGNGPDGNLIVDSAGNFYGENTFGGLYGWGTIYELSASGSEIVLYNFTGGSDGGWPHGGVLRDADGDLFGTSLTGGKLGHTCSNTGCGVAFRLTPQGTLEVLHTFTGGEDGGTPEAALITDGANFYGTTAFGGLAGGCGGFGCGVVFKINLQRGETILHTFTGLPDGQAPVAPLIGDSQGNLYGTAADGGSSCSLSRPGCGVIFKLDSAGNETILYSFTGQGDGAGPGAGLIRDSAGNLYGTTVYGGDLNGVCAQAGCGVVFKLDASGTETALYAFTDGNDGASPESSLVQDSHGNLYGSTDVGGNFSEPCPSYGCGVVFKLSPAGRLDVLHTFAYTDGWTPSSALLEYKGYLYGTTRLGGSFGEGDVFKLQP